MTGYGLLIDYDFCTGCHVCETACKVELGLPVGQWGIQLTQHGPRKIGQDKWEYTFVPIPTELCNLCEERVNAGKKPTCVHHCQTLCMEFGPVDELAKKITKPRMVLFAPK